ncbi:MAG: carboxypeptidase-like regulatory domain-containing protein, partial [Bacteroidia bacterium]
MDETTGEALEFASLIVKGTSAGTQCNENGVFSIACKTLPSTLIIYKIGYQTREVPVSGEKAELFITMKPKALLLAEVEVSSKRTEIFQEKNQTEYLCFDFYDNLIIALTNKGALRNVIQMISETGEVVKEKQAPKGVETIFRDCFGNIQLLSKDSSYQVFFNYEDIILQKPFPMAQFRQFLEPCQCSY